MKFLIKMFVMVLVVGLFSSTASAQEKTKKVKTFTVSKVLPFAAEKVWQNVGVDYGAVAYSHPRIVDSEYINGSLKAGEGAERLCNFNEKGTQYLQEKMLDYDPAKMTFINQITRAGKFPVDPSVTRAVYSVKPIDANSSQLTFEMKFRTKPSFMGGMMKGSFQKLIQDYFIAIEHHLATGEKVNKENFKEVKKQYTR